MGGLDEIQSELVEKAGLGKGPIFQIANECDKLFDSLSQKSTGTGQGPAPDLPTASSMKEVPLIYLVGEFHSRFLSWASYLGVFAGEHMNLDAKLKERPELADIVLLTLDKLRGNLHHLLAIELPPAANETDIEDGDSSSSSSWGIVDDSDDSHQSNLRDFIIGCIRESVGKLNRLAIVIHSSASTSTPSDLFARVRRYAARHLAEDMASLETSFNHTLQLLYPNADDCFKRQILKSALFRFAKLRCRQSHQEKLESITRQDEKPTLGSSLDEGTLDVGDMSQNGTEDEKKTVLSTGGDSSINLSVAKSHAKMKEPEISIFHCETRSQMRRGTSVWIGATQYPEAPPVRLTTPNEQTVCPYCYTRQEDEVFTDKDSWQQHVDEDLEPFVCIFETCGETASFTNFQNWCRHLKQVHTEDWLWQILPEPLYRCKHPSHDEKDPDPRPRDHFETNIVFTSLADILDHFEKSHGQIILIPKAKGAYLDPYFPFIEFLVCPLCQASMQSSIFLASDATTEANEMTKHISNHVHDIAFRLLDIARTSRDEGGTLDANTSHPPKTLGCSSESSARPSDSKGLDLAIPSFCADTGPRKTSSGDLYAGARTVVIAGMDYYRLSAMARSEDGCKSRKHIEAILKSLHPSIQNASKPLFQSHEDRERKMFFSKEPLKTHFEDPTNIQSLLKCKCTDCIQARGDDDKLPSLNDSVDLSKKPRFLALMTYLGKVHYIHYWMRRGIVNRHMDHLPACPNDGFLKDLINNSSERENFRSAYERALNMLCPHVFEISPTMICPYSDFNYPNFEDLRFPYQNERLNKTQGFFGVMTRLEIHPDYLDSSVLNRMKGYPRIDRNQPPLFALKSVKITAGIPVAKMERDVLMPPGKTARLALHESLPDHWLWEQIQGVSCALSAFHTGMENPFTNVEGRVIALHFDLKPANILVTANGTLKITDFGQSIMQIVKEDGQITTPYNPGHPRYEPPESLQIAEELGEVSRRGVKDIEVLLNYDVWSLACIMIEVLIHLLDTQTLDDFDKKLETEPVGRFWIGNVLKQGVMDSFEHFRQRFIHDTDQSQYMEDVIQLLHNMLVHDKHKRVHSQEVVQGLEKAKTNFGELQQGTDPVCLRVRTHKIHQLKKFRELAWNDGKSFSEKEGITLNVIEQKDGRPFYPDILEPVPCRIRLFSKPPTSGSRPSQIGFIWGLQRNREVVVSEQIISEPSEWCFAPTYLFHNHTNGNTRFECRLFPRKFDLAFIFEFASADDVLLFQETLLQVRILRPMSALVLSIRPKRKSDTPVFNTGQSYVQLWKKAEPKYLSGPSPSRRTRGSTYIGSFSSASSLRNSTTRSATDDQCKMMVIFFEGLFPLMLTLNNGQKKFKSPSSREVQISRRHDSYLAMQPQVHSAWKIDNGGGTQITHEVPSVPIEIDEDKLQKQDGIKTFDIDRMEIILGNHRDFNRFQRGTTNEWR